MKTILQLKKLLVIPLLFLVGNVCGQTWSSSPSLNTYTNVGSNSSITCSFGTVVRYEVQARVTNLNSSTFTVQFRKMNGGTFGSAGTAVIVDNTECNTSPIAGGGTLNYASGSTGGTFTNATHNVTPGTSKTFYVRIKPTGTNWYIALPITISATSAPQPPNLQLTQCIGYSGFPNTVQGNTVNTNLSVTNTGGSFTGSLYVSLHNASNTYLMDLGIWNNVTIPANGNYNSTIQTSPALTQAISNGYKVFAKFSTNGTTFTTIGTGNSGCANPATVNIIAPPSPNLQLTQCIGYSGFPNTVQGNTVNTNLSVTNTGGSFTGSLYVSLHNASNTYLMDLGIWNNVTIPANGNYNSTIQTSPALTQAISNGYKVFAKFSTNGTTFTTIGTGNSGCANPATVNIIAPPSPNLQLTQCLGYSGFPNTIQGNTVNTNLSITNTGGSFTGSLYVSLHNASNTYLMDLGIWNNVTIPANGNYSSSIQTSPALTQAISNGYKVFAKFSTNGTTFTTIGTGNSGCANPATVNITAPPSCITWTGTPPTGEKLTAANYLCTNGIIINTQNGTDNATNGIPRELLAKITYLGIYKGSTPNSPAVNFPVPFTDMQGSTSPYLDAIKTLAYLQFTDDKTPFDRDLINFNPNTLIPRKYVVKAMAEAFNIAKSTATPSPFTDVNTTDEMYGYIKRFHELGFVTGNTQYTTECTTGTCFHPDANITREDVFVILYRILIATNITRPTATQLNSITNYFVPGNNRTATMGKVPGLDQANFNHYQKTSFSIAGRGIPLDFTHTYNSFLTELPKGYFEDGASGQSFSPLGIGWTHTYNIYAVKVAGYTFGSVTEPDKIMFYYPDGSINVYNYATNACENIGVYDVMAKTTISGGERITITTKGQMKYVFENANNGYFYFIKTIKDRNNNGLKINWSNYVTTKYRIASVQEEFNNSSLGRSLTFNYASSILPYLSSISDNSIGRTISFNVALQTRSLTSYTDPKNQVTQYTYDDANNYNKSNLLTEILLPKGNKIQNTYVNRKLTSSKTFSQANVATSTTNVNWVPNYSASGYNSAATVTDPQGKNTNFTHNTLGNPTQVVAPTGTTNFNNYGTGNNQNLPTSLTVNGQSSSVSYDTNGNVLNITKNGITNAFTYNTLNDVLTHTDGRSFTTNYSYDGLGNLISVQRPSGGGTTTISRNSFGQVQSVSNPSSIFTQFGFNTNGLTNQISMPLGITTSSIYDNASRLVSTTDANGKINSFQYDANDNLTQSTDANTQIVQHTYDANDNHLTIKNPKNETQTNTYNFDDDLLASEVFGSHTKSYTYNVDGSLATHTRGNGTFTYSYNNTTGRLTSDGHTSYAYDTRGNITTITNSNGSLTLNYDNNDRMTSYTDYYNNTISYLYDNNNNVTRITYPANKQVNYVYDTVNRCTSVTDWNNKVSTYTYLTDDRVSKITLPNGTFTDYTYDSAGRMTSTINKKANGTVISSYSYTMDNAGNHLTETITEPSITAGLQTIANETVNYGTYPFNRIQSQGSTNFTHNTAGGITQAGANSFTYDINDNMLTAPNSTFSYDGAGNRRAKTVNGANTRYVLSILGMSQVLMETNSSNVVQNHYVYGPTGLLYRVKADNTTYSYYHYDYRGSTTAITNETQNVTHSYSYDPFGKVIAKTEADTNPFQYVGQHGVQYENPTLTFMRARYYDPTTGRFVSEDPIWHLNLYPYADNNPIMNVDPKGTLPISLIYDIGKMTGEAVLSIYESEGLIKSAQRFYDLGVDAQKKGLTKQAMENFASSSFYANEANRVATAAINKFYTDAFNAFFEYVKGGIMEKMEGKVWTKFENKKYANFTTSTRKFYEKYKNKVKGMKKVNEVLGQVNEMGELIIDMLKEWK